uniref:Gap junction beta-4 protein n=2 Tax=Zea mays TaxID=4577 RepID=A0A804N191_MAIZE
MGKLLCDPSAAAVAEALPPSPAPAPPPPLLAWSSPAPASSPEASISPTGWDAVWALEDQQRRRLHRIWERGVAWKPSSPGAGEAALPPVVFRLDHGGEVDADGNCLFTAARTAAAAKADARELRHRAVRRFAEVYAAAGEDDKNAVDAAVRHLYAPDLKAGWGVHVVQEIKVLVPKAQRHALDSAIQELVDLGIQREIAAETIYKERCITVDNGDSWTKYMSISGSSEDEHDIITLQYTEEGLLTIDENRDGRAAAFGDDIAIECLATEFKREVYVVQAHGADAMVDEDNCVFFLPHRPRGEVCEPPIFLFMKGTACYSRQGSCHPLRMTAVFSTSLSF